MKICRHDEGNITRLRQNHYKRVVEIIGNEKRKPPTNRSTVLSQSGQEDAYHPLMGNSLPTKIETSCESLYSSRGERI